MMVFNTGPNAMTMDFNAGDIGSVRKIVGHYVAKWPDNGPGVMPNSGGSKLGTSDASKLVRSARTRRLRITTSRTRKI
jgi:hypothetical protein